MPRMPLGLQTGPPAAGQKRGPAQGEQERGLSCGSCKCSCGAKRHGASAAAQPFRTGLQSRLLANLTRHCGQLFSLMGRGGVGSGLGEALQGVSLCAPSAGAALTTTTCFNAHICVRSQASMHSLQKRCMQAETARVLRTMPVHVGEGPSPVASSSIERR